MLIFGNMCVFLIVLPWHFACGIDWHTLDRLKIGLAVSHDPHTYECIKWKVGWLFQHLYFVTCNACFKIMVYFSVCRLSWSRCIVGKLSLVLHLQLSSSLSPPADNIWAMMIIRTVLCCIMYDSCAQWYAQTYKQFLKLTVVLGLGFL